MDMDEWPWQRQRKGHSVKQGTARPNKSQKTVMMIHLHLQEVPGDGVLCQMAMF